MSLFYFLMFRRLQISTLFPYTTLFRSRKHERAIQSARRDSGQTRRSKSRRRSCLYRSEEHTSELQSRREFVCRLLLEKKKIFKFYSYQPLLITFKIFLLKLFFIK